MSRPCVARWVLGTCPSVVGGKWRCVASLHLVGACCRCGVAGCSHQQVGIRKHVAACAGWCAERTCGAVIRRSASACRISTHHSYAQRALKATALHARPAVVSDTSVVEGEGCASLLGTAWTDEVVWGAPRRQGQAAPRRIRMRRKKRASCPPSHARSVGASKGLGGTAAPSPIVSHWGLPPSLRHRPMWSSLAGCCAQAAARVCLGLAVHSPVRDCDVLRLWRRLAACKAVALQRAGSETVPLCQVAGECPSSSCACALALLGNHRAWVQARLMSCPASECSGWLLTPPPPPYSGAQGGETISAVGMLVHVCGYAACRRLCLSGHMRESVPGALGRHCSRNLRPNGVGCL